MKHLNYTSLITNLKEYESHVAFPSALHPFTRRSSVFFGASLLTTQQIHAKAVDTTLDIAE